MVDHSVIGRQTHWSPWISLTVAFFDITVLCSNRNVRCWPSWSSNCDSRCYFYLHSTSHSIILCWSWCSGLPMWHRALSTAVPSATCSTTCCISRCFQLPQLPTTISLFWNSWTQRICLYFHMSFSRKVTHNVKFASGFHSLYWEGRSGDSCLTVSSNDRVLFHFHCSSPSHQPSHYFFLTHPSLSSFQKVES